MSGTKTRGFQVIGDEEPQKTVDTSTLTKINTEMLLLALKTLSQRALTAITNLFTVILVASAWWLWTNVLPNPTTQQLIALGGYALFCLLIEMVRRRK
jgi:prepilin signal peptidase PulO-like enzyme (type II secretory pathway)